MNRREMLIKASASLTAALAGPAFAAEPLKELRIGYQKIGALLIVKAQKVLEQRFEPQGVRVTWVEFNFGPPLLEALAAGAIDYGYTGDAPPIFAQAAHANLLYAATIPTRGYGQAIVVRADSPIQDIAGLKGKKVAVAKASSAHNLVVAALESAKVPWTAITPVYLAPPDAASAFARGAVDAWSIWDPFFAIAELKQKARALPLDRKVSAQNSFFLVNAGFAAKHPDVVATINGAIATATTWADQHRDQVAAILAEASGVDLTAENRSVKRAEFTFGPLNDDVLAEQQAVADRFQRLGLIPAPIHVRDIVWPWKSNT
ncbi:MAG TPA: aliphatic sulfonate ABC transporter substrate-binding protein [Roseiarcus sp.]